jgi:hypothetical protein
MTHYLLLLQWQGNSAARGDRLNTYGRFVPYAKRPTSLGLVSPGTLPPVRATSKHDVLLCAIDKDFFNKVADEMEHERIAWSAVAGGPIASDEPNFYDVSVDFGRRSQPDTIPEGLLQNKEENRRFEAAFQPATDHINGVLAKCGAPPMPRLVFDCICVLPDLLLQCTGEAFELL